MLLTSVVIIIREVLEAALLVSILLSLCRQLELSRGWFKWAMLLGLFGSIIYGRQMGDISASFDGIGQELSDSLLQILIYICLLYSCVALVRCYFRPQSAGYLLTSAMVLGIAFAVTREGAEIYIYLSAFAASAEVRTSLYSGSIIGLGIGLSFCALFYYWLRSFSVHRALLIGCMLLTLVAGGMVVQAGKMLIQADLLPDGQIWDSSYLISETSMVGQLLYAMLGYEASPAPIQLTMYFIALVLMGSAIGIMYFRGRVAIQKLGITANE
jgi:high-affinity iron transporter